MAASKEDLQVACGCRSFSQLYLHAMLQIWSWSQNPSLLRRCVANNQVAMAGNARILLVLKIFRTFEQCGTHVGLKIDCIKDIVPEVSPGYSRE